MPRPKKFRKICMLPETNEFRPVGTEEKEPVVLSVDEYEIIRLLDYENMTQEQCANQMEVSRTSITAAYEQARKKIADALINGKKILIQGGDFQLCEHGNECCSKKCCKNQCPGKIQ